MQKSDSTENIKNTLDKPTVSGLVQSHVYRYATICATIQNRIKATTDFLTVHKPFGKEDIQQKHSTDVYLSLVHRFMSADIPVSLQ